MRNSRFSRSFTLAVGSLAALLGIGTTAQAVGASAAPNSDENTTTVDPSSFDTATTLESCTAMFGLTKMNSDLASFDVVETGTPYTPVPVMGTNITPVITLSDGATTHSCEAVPGWTDAATFLTDYINTDPVGGAIDNGRLAYPGTGFYLLPAIDGGGFTVGGSPFTPTTRTLTFPSDVPSPWVVTGPSTAPAFQSQFVPFISLPTTVAELSDPYWVDAFAMVAAAPGVTAAEMDYLRANVEYFVANGTTNCSDTDPLFLSLGPKMQAIIDPMNLTVGFCGDLYPALSIIGRIAVFDAEVADTVLTVTVAGEPIPTTTVVPDPITPSFTG